MDQFIVCNVKHVINPIVTNCAVSLISTPQLTQSQFHHLQFCCFFQKELNFVWFCLQKFTSEVHVLRSANCLCTFVCRTCVSHCPLGHYEDIASRRCRRCYKGCERCVGQSAGDCLSCRRGLYLNILNSSCINTCPPGYFADESKWTHPWCRPNLVVIFFIN